MPTTLIEIYRESDTHNRLSLFGQAVLKGIEALLFEKNGKPYLQVEDPELVKKNKKLLAAEMLSKIGS